MSKARPRAVSIVVPVYNESQGLRAFHKTLAEELARIRGYLFEVIYVDDGSRDDSLMVLTELHETDERIRVVRLTRNFGKEIATTAGIHEAEGEAVITLDGDGQHPVELIGEFVGLWQTGHKVVIGLRHETRHASLPKRLGSSVFYWVMNHLAGVELMPGATDFRLIDRSVQQEFVRMTEHGRITRGLIDWLGYEKMYLPYDEKPRMHGSAGYSLRKLSKLFIDSVISLSVSPLYIAAYIGAVVLPLSLVVALAMLINALVGDPLQWHATGSAYVIVLILFLVGVLLVSQGIIGLYLSHIHTETQNRPLYIVDRANSIGATPSDSEA